MAKAKQPATLLKGTAKHRRTESDYMAILLDTVTLDDWQDVIANTLELAKQGDAPARAWLAQFLMGKPVSKAPTALNVIVNQLSGHDAVIEKLATPIADKFLYPSLHTGDDLKDKVKTIVEAELAEKVPVNERR